VAKPTPAEDTLRRQRDRHAFFAYLDKRIPELHAQGTLGATARVRAEQEYRLMRKRPKEKPNG
jgi:hypothetical protein